jgi:hypothetical protein
MEILNWMKKLLVLAVAALAALSLQAQEIRTNYRSEGMTHISTDYELLEAGNVPVWTRVELVGFPDGSTLYVLYMNLEQKNATAVPKGVKMAVTLSNGKIVRLEQIGQDSATKRRLDNGLFWNRLKYAVEAEDMEKMVRGIKSVDIVTGWNPDDYIQANFADDALGSLLKRHCEAILKAADNTIDLQATLAGHTDNLNSIMNTANPVVGKGDRFLYNIILSLLYYKNTNTEDIDLAFMLGTQDSYHFEYDAAVRFTLKDGSVIELKQTRDDVNFIYVFPSLEDLRRMAEGIESLSLVHENGVVVETFTQPLEEGEFSFADAVNQQLQLLLSLSER